MRNTRILSYSAKEGVEGNQYIESKHGEKRSEIRAAVGGGGVTRPCGNTTRVATLECTGICQGDRILFVLSGILNNISLGSAVVLKCVSKLGSGECFHLDLGHTSPTVLDDL